MTIFGWDLSHYDSPNVGAVLAEGFSFLTHKAGGDAIDAELGSWWSNVRNLPEDQMLLGAYWVLYPGNPTSRADAFLARLDSQCPGWRDRDAFILQADCEIWNGDTSTKPSKADIQAFCDRLHAKTGLIPVVYASAGQYGSGLTGLTYPLWNARYPLNYQAGFASVLYERCGGDSGSGWSTYSGQTPAIWQFTSSATIAGQTTCDANAYRGTLADLKSLVTGEDMALTKADAGTVWNTDGVVPNRSWRSDKSTNDTLAAASAMGIAMDEAHAANVGVANLAKQVTALGNSLMTAMQAIASKDAVDERALAEALAPGVAAAVIAALPPTSDPISVDEVTTALQRTLRAAFGGTGA